VGPWNVEHPSYMVLIVPGLFLLLLLGALCWAARTRLFGPRVSQVIAKRSAPVFTSSESLPVSSSISSMP